MNVNNQPAILTHRSTLMIIGAILLLFACVGGSLIIYLILGQPKDNPSTPPALLEFTASPTPEPTAVPATSTPPAPTNTPGGPTLTPTVSSGESCFYSEAWINAVATPIPHGGYSAYQDYHCNNGFWEVGTGDWVDRTGAWGPDGSKENMYVKFNKDGVEIDRKYIDLQGKRIP